MSERPDPSMLPKRRQPDDAPGRPSGPEADTRVLERLAAALGRETAPGPATGQP